MNNILPIFETNESSDPALSRRISYHITDRRLNPGGKNLNNRQRFMERVNEKIKQSVAKGLNRRGVSDQSDAEISISKDGIEEPSFQYDTNSGVWDYLLPGNKEYQVGDTIPRPTGGAGAGGSKGAPDGEGEDEFRFYVSYDEYINAIFGDLELPEMVKESEKSVVSFVWRRAGYTTVGPASNLALEQTMIKGISRRIALKTPKLVRITELKEELEEETDENRRLEIELEIAELQARAAGVPFLDKTDLRYHNTVKHPLPITQACMFCLMDVSGSMTEHMKDLAKRFYILLYIFLKRQYKDVDVIFIRHTHVAIEVDEDTFFHSPETGGTVVSTAYEEMEKIVRARYPVDQWNIYCAQVSDGDNTASDNEKCEHMLNYMLPWMQYLTYIEVGRDGEHFPSGFVRRDSDLWQLMAEIVKSHPNKVAVRKYNNKNELIEMFRSIFKKRDTE
jgi:uncharacterized protein